MLTKEQTERITFEALAWVSGMAVRPGSIQQLRPPRPDIECTLVDGTPLAVELVSLDAAETQKRLSNMYATSEAWQRALETREPDQRTLLLAECSDAFISLNISELAGARDRKDILSEVQSALLEKPSGFKGELFEDFEMPKGLMGCTVQRGGVTDGPRILAPSAGSWMPPQYTKITKKLTTKTYATDAPLGLFAYSTHDEIAGSVDSLPTLIEAIAKDLPGSRFSRVRVFDLFRRKVEYVSP